MKSKLLFIFLVTAASLVFFFIYIKKDRPTLKDVNLIHRCLDSGVPSAEIIGIDLKTQGNKSKLSPAGFFSAFSGIWRRSKAGESVDLEFASHNRNLIIKFSDGRSVDCEIKEFNKYCFVEMRADSIGDIIVLYIRK